MIILEWSNIVYPSITLSLIQIKIGTGDVTGTLHPDLIRLGEFTLGNDEPENDLYMFPGRLSIEFEFPAAQVFSEGVFIPSVSDAYNDYYNALDQLHQHGATIFIYKEGQDDIFFVAGFNKEDDGLLRGSNSGRRIALLFLDDYTKLNEESSISDPLSESTIYPGGGNYKTLQKLSTLVRMLFELSPRGEGQHTPVYSVEFLTQLRFRRLAGQSPDVYEYVPLSDTGIPNYLFYGGQTKGYNLKSFLQSIASFAVIDFNRKMKILPLWYDGGTTILIKNEEVEGGSEVIYGKSFEGLIAKFLYVDTGLGLDIAGLNVVERDYGSVIRRHTRIDGRTFDHGIFNEDRITTIELRFPVGVRDNVDGKSFLLGYIDGEGNGHKTIIVDSASYKMADGNWSEEKSLGEWAAHLSFEYHFNKARRFKATLPGINYTFGNFFRVEGLTQVFRPVQLSYNYESDQTTIIVRECTNSDVYGDYENIFFNKMLEAFNLKLYKLRKGNTWDEYTGAGQLIAYSGQKLKLEWDNPYNCRKLTAKEFDGTVLEIPDNQLNIWKDNFTIPIYIGVGSSKTTASMEFNYPDAADSNGKWYLLANIPDQKNQDPAARIEFVISSVEETNPFWFWVGIKSSSAQLFPNIPIYTVNAW